MPPVFRIEPTDDLPATADVGDYDQLRPAAKARLAAAVREGNREVEDPVLRETARTWDVVKFTDYYQVERR